MKINEQFLCRALDRFKEMITNGECSQTDISYFCNLSKYELGRRGASVDRKQWLTKGESAEALGISTSTFDRIVQRGVLPRGKKTARQKNLLWKREEVEELKKQMLLKARR